jgi:hypothetical protein
VLRHGGAPPELGYALACSVSWHTRAPTLLLYLGEQLPDSLAAIAREHEDAGTPGAALRVVESLEQLRSFTLGERVDELFQRYEHILVQGQVADSPALGTARVIDLGAAGPASAADGAVRVPRCGWLCSRASRSRGSIRRRRSADAWWSTAVSSTRCRRARPPGWAPTR